MKFLADENVDRPIIALLRQTGHEVLAISEMNQGCRDHEVIALAKNEEAILITFDKDFGDIIFRQLWPVKGILLLRLGKMESQDKASLVKSFVDKFGDKIPGSFCVLTQRGVRFSPIRKNPLPN